MAPGKALLLLPWATFTWAAFTWAALTPGLLTSCAAARHDLIPSASGALQLQRLHDTLSHRGFKCALGETDVTCEGDRTYKVVIEYVTAPHRLLFYAWFDSDRTCEDQAAAINDFNQRYLIQLACVDGALRFFSSTLVPEAGLDGQELEAFLVAWSDEIHTSATDAGIFTPATDEKPGPKPADDVGGAQTL